ncbi:MAG: hypothetical protein KF893_15490 [Caldilineaceae bacterium]|nr:hypothetical protein [Caldilineaceae bacterium]
MSTLIRRPRLLDQVNAALSEGHLFVTAPAGYGKTMLLQSLETERPYTYLIPLTAADGDPASLRQRLEPLLQAENTLLLDDVHHLLVADAAIDWLQTQMRRPQPRWVLAGRQPLFPATDLALYAKINHLRMEDLAFNDDEAHTWLGQRLQAWDGWQRRLEGWPLGLGLLKNLEDVADPQPIAEKQLFAYLAERVLTGLSPELQRFMQVTALPLTFTHELAAHLLPESDANAATQSLLARNLFLYHDHQHDLYRYHDLIRAFLQQQLPPAQRNAIMRASVIWLHARGEIVEAIENALEGALWTEAADLLASPEAFTHIRARGHFITHHRWVMTLPPEILAERPGLLLRNGAALFHLRERRNEAWSCLEQGVALAAAANHTEIHRLGLRYMAFFHGDEGHNRQALALCQQIIALPDLALSQQIAVRQDMIALHSFLGEFEQAQICYRQVRALTATEPGGVIEQVNFASLVLAARGQRAAALTILQRVAEEVAAAQNHQDRLLILRNIGNLLLDQGDWAGQRENLAAMETIMAQMETVDERILVSLHYDRALLAVGEGRFAEAAAILTEGEKRPIVRSSPLLRILFATATVWLQRRQKHFSDAIRQADAVLATPSEFPYFRARLALERDIAAVLAALAAGDLRGFHLSPQTRALISLRARAELVRMQMLLAILYWRQGKARWRRLARRVVVAGDAPLYARLLTTRDPELAAEFWKILLVEGLEVEKSTAALREIGQSLPLLALLQHKSERVRRQTAILLAEIGQEEAMPLLATAVAAESDRSTQEAMQTALNTLESLPPPPLYIRLMGEFHLQRGEKSYVTGDFHRPIVARLLQYFVLYKERPIPRDRILEDLWPEGDPAQTVVTLRTLNSHLRTLLDPYMRPRGPNRYIVAERDNYRFDPYGVVDSDLAHFTTQVEQTLALSTLDDDRLASLEGILAGYAPLLPDLPYADWLLEPRQRLEDLYLEGANCLAEGYLAQRDWQRSQRWLRRALQIAPWLEQAWQMLMRVHARQGQRGLALKTYHEAAAALERELGVAPGELTTWLYQRIQADEPI